MISFNDSFNFSYVAFYCLPVLHIYHLHIAFPLTIVLSLLASYHAYTLVFIKISKLLRELNVLIYFSYLNLKCSYSCSYFYHC